MNDVFDSYVELIGLFLNHQLPAQEFSDRFIGRFKDERGPLVEPLFLLLDELFGDADSFTTDPDVLAEDPVFYLDEQGLASKAQDILRRMLMWREREMTATEAAVNDRRPAVKRIYPSRPPRGKIGGY